MDHNTNSTDREPKVITIYLSKGGVAKSTLVALLGKYLAAKGERVVIIDADRQGSQSEIFGLVDERGLTNEKLHMVMKREMSSRNALTPISVDVLPRLEGETPGVLSVLQGGAMTPLALVDIVEDSGQFGLDDPLDTFVPVINGLNDEADYVIIDIGPSAEDMIAVVLNVTDYLIMPTDTGLQSIERIEPVLAEVDQARIDNPTLGIIGIVLVKAQYHFGRRRMDTTTRIAREELEARFADLLLTDNNGLIDIAHDTDWDLIRWSNETLLNSQRVKKNTKDDALRFLQAVVQRLEGEHGTA